MKHINYQFKKNVKVEFKKHISRPSPDLRSLLEIVAHGEVYDLID